ncbi:MBL fold metallo-hydrolase [Aureispira anguillae]|uniref:MBL fold metallo-hydrolase n=1 Tax=Aureispira anguillae TaxID=2864201 RepID=A0A915YED4_9BACT|nr:MBL fold metallo-hydrolase [Aureispira anguillae]BDS11461.1 MBL fold metallo-hydrolase [Aureispira anguillae]
MKNKYLLITVVFFMLMGACTVLTDKNSNKISIQLIRNATLKIDYNGTIFMVDPSLSPPKSFMSFVVPNENLNPTVDLPLSIKNIVDNVDAVLLTHSHLDHFDQGAKDYLNSELPFFIQPTDKEVFSKGPFSNYSVVNEKTEFKNTSIIRTKGKHGPDALLEDLGQVSGYILKAKSQPTIYIIGDCLFDAEIKETIREHQPAIIIANTGGAIWGESKILMDENSVVELAKFTPTAKIIAVHMEALDHCKTTRKMVSEKAKNEQVDIVIPNDGEILRF